MLLGLVVRFLKCVLKRFIPFCVVQMYSVLFCNSLCNIEEMIYDIFYILGLVFLIVI